MKADPEADLIYAILSLDAYNRGYGSGITDLTLTDKLGSFTISKDSSSLVENGQRQDRPAGFYAIAYRNTATNEVVISYRGTDFNGNLPSLGVVSRARHTHHASS